MEGTQAKSGSKSRRASPVKEKNGGGGTGATIKMTRIGEEGGEDEVVIQRTESMGVSVDNVGLEEPLRDRGEWECRRLLWGADALEYDE